MANAEKRLITATETPLVQCPPACETYHTVHSKVKKLNVGGVGVKNPDNSENFTSKKSIVSRMYKKLCKYTKLMMDFSYISKVKLELKSQ